MTAPPQLHEAKEGLERAHAPDTDRAAPPPWQVPDRGSGGWLHSRLSHRFVFWSAAITLLVTLTLGILSFQVTSLLLERNLQRTLEYHLKFYAENLSDRLGDTLLFARGLAENSVISSALADSEGRQTYLLPFMRDARIPLNIPFNLHLCDFKGRPLVSKRTGMLPDIPYAQWADAVVEQKKTMAGISPQEGWVALALPVIYRGTGRPEGMLVLEFDFTALNRTTNRILEEGSRSSYWFSSLGGAPQGATGGGLLLQQALALPAPLDLLGLNIAVGQDLTSLEERLRLLLFHYLLVLVGTVFLTVGLTLYLVRRLIRPLAELTQVAGEIADQGTPNRYAKVEGWDELGELAHSFNRMVERLHTSQSDLEHRVEERTRDLLRMQHEAESANRAKSEFLSIVTHEIRTPLNVIIGLGDQLAESPLEGEQRHQLEVLRRAGEMLLTLINDVLELAKVESGGMILSQTRFDLEEVVHGTAELIAARAREKKIQLLTWIHADTPLLLLGDEKRLRHVLLNLLGNSLKFTEQGSITLEVRRLFVADGGPRLLFALRDTGIGIPTDKIQMIFEPFTQVDTSIARRYQGSGLGLAIARRFVEQMGGTLQVESALGAGSLFQFDLPLQCQEPEPPQPPLPLPGLRVALRVGSAFNRRALLDLLPSLGVTPSPTPDAPESTWDLLITDVAHGDASSTPLTLRLLSAPPGQMEASSHESFLIEPWSRATLLRGLRNLLGTVLPAPHIEKARPATPRFDGARVLLVEDAEDNILLMEAFLRGTRCHLSKARNGQEALDLFMRESFDLVLMDIQMPVMDGMEATRRMRGWEQQQGRLSTPIVALTAFAWAEEGGACVLAGCTGHLAKPVRKAQIFQMMRTHLQEVDPEA